VAAQEARNFFTLNHTSVERDVDRVLALATGEFKKEYASRRKVIVQDVRARKLQVVATLPANAAAVEYLSGSQARVLVAVDAHTRTSGESVGKRFRSRVTLRKVDGAWLVAKFEQV
jgi:Mce-associated membrane protein